MRHIKIYRVKSITGNIRPNKRFRIGGEIHKCWFRIGPIAIGRFERYLFGRN